MPETTPSSPCPRCGLATETRTCPRCDDQGFALGSRGKVVLAGLIVASGTIIMAVVAVFAARAIPPGHDARTPANEAAARGHLDTIARAQVQHLGQDADKDGARDYATLEELVAEGLLDPTFARGPRSNYLFACEPGPGPSFALTAAPLALADRHLGRNERGETFAGRAPFGTGGGTLRLPPDAVALDRPGR